MLLKDFISVVLEGQECKVVYVDSGEVKEIYTSIIKIKYTLPEIHEKEVLTAYTCANDNLLHILL